MSWSGIDVMQDFFKCSDSKKKYIWWFVVSWIVLLVCLLARDLVRLRKVTRNLAIREAQAHFQKDEAFRFWVATHGGFYVPVDERTRPNPYLDHVSEQNITTPSGKQLTLMNPAYALRQMQEEFAEVYGVFGHITSLLPLRPDNAPDDWERNSLELFEKGTKEVLEFTMLKGEPGLRLMRPLIIQKGCLKCHEHQGYKIGQVRGGVSVSIPFSIYLQEERQAATTQVVSYIIIMLIGLIALFRGNKVIISNIVEREKAQKSLQNSHDHLEILVQERTLELSDVNTELHAEITSRKLETEKSEKQRIATLSILADLNEASKRLKKEIKDRKQAQMQVQKNLEEKNILLKEVHHRVKNNLQIMSSLLHLQTLHIDDPRISKILGESRNRIHSMSIVHEMMYQNQDFARIDMKYYIYKLIDSIKPLYADSYNHIDIIDKCKSVEIDLNRAIPCGMIINELISNAMKHAFVNDSNGEITVGIENEDGEVHIFVSDNGSALPPDFDLENINSLGMSIVTDLTDQLDGRFVINQKDGLKTFEVFFNMEN